MNSTQEKAYELAMKFDEYGQTDNAIQCAIIAVDEILEYIDSKGNGYYTLPDDLKNEYDYYQEVKQHLEEML